METIRRGWIALAAVVAGLALAGGGSGCVLLPTLRGAPPELEPPPGRAPVVALPPAQARRATVAATPTASPGAATRTAASTSAGTSTSTSAAVTATALLDLRGIIHCHSELSHDSPGTLASIVEAAQAVGVRFVFMTDHYTVRGVNEGARGLHGGVLFTAGTENGRCEGSIMGISIGEARPPLPGKFPIAGLGGEAPVLVRQLHEAGGLAFIGHCETFDGWKEVTDWDGIEVMNLHAATAAKPWWFYPSGLVLPPGAFLRRVVAPDAAVLARWDELGRARRVPGYGGADAHASIRVFGPLGGVIGDYQECFRAVSTHLLARDCTVEALTEALLEGRGYVAFEIDGDATGFTFDLVEGGAADAPSRPLASVATQGAEVRYRPGLAALVRCPGGDRVRARILRDGASLLEGPGALLRAPLDGPGVYRVEAWLDDRPFVLSNPIYVRG